MIEILRTVKQTKYKYKCKAGEFESSYGAIRFPKFFIGKIVEVTFFTETFNGNDFEGETRPKKFMNAKIAAVICIPKLYIGRRCSIKFEDGDVIEYFKSRYGETP